MSFRNADRRRSGRRIAALRRQGRELARLAEQSPELALNMLYRSFVYPEPSEPEEEDLPTLKRAERRKLNIEIVDGHDTATVDLVLHRWQGDGSGPTIAFFHDWEHEAGYWCDYVDPLLDKGCTILALDAPASGSSSGSRLSLADYVSAVHATLSSEACVHAAVGHGLGGAALLQAMAQLVGSGCPERVVIMGANANSRDIFQRRLTALSVTERLRFAFWKGLELGETNSVHAFDNVLAAERLGETKGLIVHDATDARYPLEDAEQIAAVWPGAELKRFEGHGHELDTTAVRHVVVPFVSARKLLRRAA